MNNQLVEHMKLLLSNLKESRDEIIATVGDESVDWEFVSGQIHAVEYLLSVAEGLGK